MYKEIKTASKAQQIDKKANRINLKHEKKAKQKVA